MIGEQTAINAMICACSVNKTLDILENAGITITDDDNKNHLGYQLYRALTHSINIVADYLNIDKDDDKAFNRIDTFALEHDDINEIEEFLRKD